MMPCLSSQDYQKQVFIQARQSIQTYACSEAQLQLLLHALAGLEQQAEEDSYLFFIHFPRLIYGMIQGETTAALPLSVIITLLFLGIDLLDDIADQDLPAHWQTYNLKEIQLAATTLVATLPQLLLSQLNVSSACQIQLHKTLAQGLLVMSAGQLSDFRINGQNTPLSTQVENSILAKSGEELALFACLATQFAGAESRLIEKYTELGRALGTAAQLASDCYDLFSAAWSKDLANGTRTLPIAIYLEKKTNQKKDRFLELIHHQPKNEKITQEIRSLLLDAGVVRHCAIILEIYCQRALGILTEVSSDSSFALELRQMIESISFFLPANELNPYSREKKSPEFATI